MPIYSVRVYVLLQEVYRIVSACTHGSVIGLSEIDTVPELLSMVRTELDKPTVPLMPAAIDSPSLSANLQMHRKFGELQLRRVYASAPVGTRVDMSPHTYSCFVDITAMVDMMMAVSETLSCDGSCVAQLLAGIGNVLRMLDSMRAPVAQPGRSGFAADAAQPLVLAPAPVAQPLAPVAQPLAPVAQPLAPVAQPPAPVAQPPAPVVAPVRVRNRLAIALDAAASAPANSASAPANSAPAPANSPSTPANSEQPVTVVPSSRRRVPNMYLSRVANVRRDPNTPVSSAYARAWERRRAIYGYRGYRTPAEIARDRKLFLAERRAHERMRAGERDTIGDDIVVSDVDK